MSFLLENTAIGLALAALVAAAVRIVRPRPAVAHVMWLCVLVSLLAPRLVRFPVPLPAPTAVETARTPVRHADVADHAFDPVLVSAPTSTRRAAPAATRTPTPGFSWRDVLLAAWIVGGAAMLAFAGLAAVRLRRRLREGTAPSAALGNEVHRVAAQLGIAPPHIRVVAGVETPFVWALGRATLVWPRGYAADDPTRRRVVIAHELAHLRRGDHWVARLEMLAATALWWHPLFWFVRARMREHAELACDAWAVWAEPRARHAYATALIDALESRSRATVALPALGARPRSRRAIEKRLMMVLHDDVPRRLSVRALAPVAALALAAFSGFTFAQERERADPVEGRRIERQVERQVDRRVNREVRRAIARELRQAGVDAATIRKVLQTYDRELERADQDRLIRVDRRDAGGRERERADVRGETPPEGRSDARPQDPVRQRNRAMPGLLQAAIRIGLEEARAEIRADEDLQELGLTDDVLGLLDAFAQGGTESPGFDRALGHVIQQGLRAGIEEAKAEIRNDEDLKRLGLDASIGALLDSLAEGSALQSEEFTASVGEMVRTAMRASLDEARAEIRADEDLEKLGLTDDVLDLLDTIQSGEGVQSEAFTNALEKVIQGAIQGGLKEARAEGLDPKTAQQVESILQQLLHSEIDARTEKELESTLERLIEDAKARAEQDEQRRRRDR